MIRKLCMALIALAMLVTPILGLAEGFEQSSWQNILLLGGDSRDMETYGRTDSMMILSLNTETAEVKLTSIMRDTWVNFPGNHGSNKINAANVFGGPELAMATVNECFGTDIEDYALVNMGGLVEIVDRVGGVDLDITDSEMRYINSHAANYLKTVADAENYGGATKLNASGKGVHLNGLLAMSYSRIRYADSDYVRVQRQQKVLRAVASKLAQMDTTAFSKAVMDMEDWVDTSLSRSDIVYLAKKLKKADLSSVGQYRIPADNTFESGLYQGVWSIRPDFEKNAALLRQFIYGQ